MTRLPWTDRGLNTLLCFFSLLTSHVLTVLEKGLKRVVLGEANGHNRNNHFYDIIKHLSQHKWHIILFK